MVDSSVPDSQNTEHMDAKALGGGILKTPNISS
ncbi:hypothetical protein HMPREF1091_01397 [Atopobium minutum 10063974]|uniref:Uncharacterized protein n=1 Tax=Atopobium minutum 10063974 TaxID=997872 RepID=N2BUA9_9ACTN|nr:hypothetical protein HMPREF1091_01397 [Atopobium minutum 10063974]